MLHGSTTKGQAQSRVGRESRLINSSYKKLRAPSSWPPPPTFILSLTASEVFAQPTLKIPPELCSGQLWTLPVFADRLDISTKLRPRLSGLPPHLIALFFFLLFRFSLYKNSIKGLDVWEYNFQGFLSAFEAACISLVTLWETTPYQQTSQRWAHARKQRPCLHLHWHVSRVIQPQVDSSKYVRARLALRWLSSKMTPCDWVSLYMQNGRQDNFFCQQWLVRRKLKEQCERYGRNLHLKHPKKWTGIISRVRSHNGVDAVSKTSMCCVTVMSTEVSVLTG